MHLTLVGWLTLNWLYEGACVTCNVLILRAVVDLQTYPQAVFYLFMAFGLYLIRYRRRKLGLPRSSFRAWDIAVLFNIASNLYLVIMPWYPPSTGRYGGDVSFWYATYVVVGIGM